MVWCTKIKLSKFYRALLPVCVFFTIWLLVKNNNNVLINDAILSHSGTGDMISKRVTLNVNLKPQTNNTLVKSNYTQSSPSKTANQLRPYSCHSCFQHNFNYLILNEDLCQRQPNQAIDIFIIIFTIPKNSKERNLFRSTWLTVSRNNTANIRYGFFLGKSNDPALKVEANMFHDLIMEDYIDSYANLTYKTLSGFKYVSNYCSYAKYVFKVDNDVWVNVKGLQIAIQQYKEPLRNKVGGKCLQSAKPIRTITSKYYTSLESYPANSYPAYCDGTGYVMQTYIAMAILHISQNIPFYHLEDIYVAFCIKKLGIEIQNIPGFRVSSVSYNRQDPCFYKRDNVITLHDIVPSFIQTIWDATDCKHI